MMKTPYAQVQAARALENKGISIPHIVAQRRDEFIGRKEGENTAKADMRGRKAGVWFVAGLSGFGALAAYKFEPAVLKLENKSLEYQTAYVEAYKSTVKSTLIRVKR